MVVSSELEGESIWMALELRQQTRHPLFNSIPLDLAPHQIQKKKRNPESE